MAKLKFLWFWLRFSNDIEIDLGDIESMLMNCKQLASTSTVLPIMLKLIYLTSQTSSFYGCTKYHALHWEFWSLQCLKPKNLISFYPSIFDACTQCFSMWIVQTIVFIFLSDHQICGFNLTTKMKEFGEFCYDFCRTPFAVICFSTKNLFLSPLSFTIMHSMYFQCELLKPLSSYSCQIMKNLDPLWLSKWMSLVKFFMIFVEHPLHSFAVPSQKTLFLSLPSF